MTEYQAGVCNINQTERKKRRLMGTVSLLNSLLLIAVLFVFPQFTPLYAGIFLLTLAGFLGLLQSRHHFCTGLAFKQQFHVNADTKNVSDPEQIAKDRKKAFSILAESMIYSLIVIGFIYLLTSL